MKLFVRPCLLLALGLWAAGCVSEPAPEDNTTFGHVDSPKKVRKHTPSDTQIIDAEPQ